MRDQQAGIDWRDDGIPVSVRFGDPYYSLQGGLDEARHVFLTGNGLPARFRDGFCIAETGFGTGLNLLAAWQAWDAAGLAGTLRFTSFEAYPLRRAAAAQALAAFPDVSGQADRLLAVWDRLGQGPVLVPGGPLIDVIVGDVRNGLPRWASRADAWFLDGFAPVRNPEMWEDALLAQIAARTAPGGTLASYTAAGRVRRGLAAAGFAIDRRAGFGRKRHMIAGVLA